MKNLFTLCAAALFAVSGMAQEITREVITDPSKIFDHPVSMYYDVTFSGLTKDLRGGPDTFLNDVNGKIGEIVMDSNDKETVLLKNPLPRYAWGSYIKGKLVENDDEMYMEFELPQFLALNSANNGAIIALSKVIVDEYENTFLESATFEKQTIRYVLDKDDNWVLELPEGYGIGNFLTAAEDTPTSKVPFWKDAVFSATYSDKENRIAAIMPEGVEAEQYGMVFSNGDRTKVVNVGFQDDIVYIQGIAKDFRKACITGKIEGDKVVFESGQFIGEAKGFSYYLVFNEAELVNINQFMEEIWDFPGKILPSVEATYDATNKIISFPLDMAMFINVGTKDPLYYADFFVGSLFAPRTIAPATPVNPSFTEIEPFNASFGMGGAAFDLPLLGTNGEVLNADLYTYIVYFDEEPYTFTPALYPGLEKPMEEIPYNFTDPEEDFSVKGMQHIIYWKLDGFSTLGIQAVYTVGGIVNKSEIVSANISGKDGVDDVMIGNDISAIEYYDLTGNKVENPEKGIYVRKMTFENGKIITSKIAIRN